MKFRIGFRDAHTLALMFRRWRESEIHRGRPWPASFAALERAFEDIAGQSTTNRDIEVEIRIVDSDGERVSLTKREFANRVGRSVRTVNRWIEAGQVQTVGVSGAHPLIPATELDRFTTERSMVPAPSSSGAGTTPTPPPQEQP